MCIPRPWLTRPPRRGTEEPSTKASKYTPGQSPRAVLTAQEHTVSTGPAVPPGGVAGWGAQNALVGFRPPSCP